jgi:Tol biopolymer transport system component
VREEDGKEIVRVSYSDGYTHPDGGYRQDIVVVQLIYDPQSGAFSVDPESEPVVFDPAMVGSDHYGGYAHFSNDGTWLAFEAYHSYPDGSRSNTICVARSDDPQSGFELIGGPGGFSADPAWSPDGTQFAFVSDPTGAALAYPHTDVYIATLDLANRRVTSTKRLTTSGTARCVTWSPDGKQICYGWYTLLNKRQSGYYVRGYYAIGTIVLATGQYFELVSPLNLGGASPSVPDWSPMDLPKLPW